MVPATANDFSASFLDPRNVVCTKTLQAPGYRYRPRYFESTGLLESIHATSAALNDALPRIVFTRIDPKHYNTKST